MLGVSALVAFVLHERRVPEPMVSMDLFRDRVFSVTSAIGFVTGFAMFGSIVYLSIYLQVVNGASPTTAGLQPAPPDGRHPRDLDRQRPAHHPDRALQGLPRSSGPPWPPSPCSRCRGSAETPPTGRSRSP
ncbi:MAG: hypothetical protein MZU95_09340 [Desulfomicrobium escambiense]|nr:hypothetical protein [Desulfomicrobium escambiense]